MPKKVSPPKLLSQRQYARSRGVSQQAVNKAVKAGRIPTTTGGKIDPVVADAAWSSRTRPRADLEPDGRTRGAGSDGTADAGNGHDDLALDRPHATYTAARALREVCLAKLARIELERTEGKLVSTEEVQALAFEAARAIRDQLLALPARLAPVLYAAPDVATCHRVLEEAILEVCAGASPEEVATWFGKGHQGSRGRA